MVWRGERAKASPARGRPCGCDHVVRHMGALQPTNPAPPTLLFNCFPWGKGSGNMVGSLDASRHGSGAQSEHTEHDHAGSVLNLVIQKHLLCRMQWMPKFVTHFYSILNTDTFLPAPLEKGCSREVTRQIHGKRWIGSLRYKAAVSILGLYHHAPFLACPAFYRAHGNPWGWRWGFLQALFFLKHRLCGNIFLPKCKSELTLSWVKSNNNLYPDIFTLFHVMEVLVLGSYILTSSQAWRCFLDVLSSLWWMQLPSGKQQIELMVEVAEYPISMDRMCSPQLFSLPRGTI